MATPQTRPYNDLSFVLSQAYVPGSGTLSFTSLAGLANNRPDSTHPIRVSVHRAGGGKTILIGWGRSGTSFTGVVVAEGKTDIPLPAGSVALIRLSAGYIADLQDTLQALEDEVSTIELTPGPQGPTGATGATGAAGSAGNPGAAGATGAAGAAGQDGAPGSVWRQGSGVPSNGTGVDGDFYLDGATDNVYKRIAGAYVFQCNIRGAAGSAGADGAPGAAGAAGAAGATGATGSAGTPGNAWRTGSGAPSNGTGIDGDLYLRTSNDDVYQRASGTYSVVANIKGSAGADGATGATGSAGAAGAAGATGATGSPGATGSAGATGATGATGPSGVVAATAPLTYDSGTQTVAITIPSSGLLKAGGSNTFATAVAGTDYLTPTGSGASLTGLLASQIGSVPTGILKGAAGAFAAATAGTDYLTPSGSGASLTALNASNLGSGTVPTARLGSGTASSSTFLRGDNTWASAGGGNTTEATFTTPTTGLFTGANMSTGTTFAGIFGSTTGGVILRAVQDAGSWGDNIRLQYVAVTSPYTLKARIAPMICGYQYQSCGVGYYDTASGKMCLLGYQSNADGSLALNKYSNVNTYSATYVNPIPNVLVNWHWIKLVDNGTNRVTSVSANGVDWIQIHTVGRTDFFTANSVCIFANANNKNGTTVFDAAIIVLSWEIT